MPAQQDIPVEQVATAGDCLATDAIMGMLEAPVVRRTVMKAMTRSMMADSSTAQKSTGPLARWAWGRVDPGALDRPSPRCQSGRLLFHGDA
jgi:hypothetical protein